MEQGWQEGKKIDGGADFAETTAQMATHGPRSHWLQAFLAP